MMTSQSFDSADYMGLVDHLNYVSNSVMFLRAEEMVKQDKVNEKTKNLSRELKSFAKQVWSCVKYQDLNYVIVDEAVKVHSRDTEESQDQKRS